MAYCKRCNKYILFPTTKGFCKECSLICDDMQPQQRDIATGDTVKFGSYIQGTSGKEAIEWIALQSEGDKVLLVSKYILDYQSFASGAEYELNIATWGESHIRQWLNDSFINSALSNEQQETIIATTHKTTSPFGSETTTDKIFLLSLDEAFDNNGTLNPLLAETERTVYVDHAAGVFASDSWWLRSDYPHASAEYPAGWFVCYVDSSGSIQRGIKQTNIKLGVRPAMWAKTKYILELTAHNNSPKTNGMYSVGSIICMGKYPQTSEIPTPLEWKILANDGKRVLLITKTPLDERPFHESKCAIDWSRSTIRKWLNNDFLNIFNPDEKARILETELNTPDNAQFNIPGSGRTTDKVFLLSVEEVERYLPHKSDRYGKAIQLYANAHPDFVITADSVDNNIYTKSMIGNCNYWLRSPGSQNNCACMINFTGEIAQYGIVNGKIPIRPAMYISIENY